DTLLSQMTLEEKAGQMNQVSGFNENNEILLREGSVGSFLNVFGAESTNRIQKIAVEETRLGIPLIFGIDVIHGYRTIFPIPLGESCSWEPDLVKRTSAMAAKEARASGIHWTFSPVVDIARDARWGRIAEGSGEDSYLGSVLAAAKVAGFQGTDISSADAIAACLKHYTAYGGANAGREYHTVDVSENTLREVYLPPFKAGVEAGAKTLMSSFNTINGIPATANIFTLREILRGEWAFKGMIVSDWGSIQELIVHGFAEDKAEAAVQAIRAGIDMDMMADVYQKNIPFLVKNGDIPERMIDEAVLRILELKQELGLFDDPYTDISLENEVILSEEHIALARESAQKSIVLLKNEYNILPIDKNIRSIAVIGPLADDKDNLLGTWHCRGDRDDVVNVLEGIRNTVSENTTVRYAKGCEIRGNGIQGIEEAVRTASRSDIVIAVVGESSIMSGEAASRTSLDLPGVQRQLLGALKDTGKPVTVILMAGRPLSIPWTAENIPAILEAWHPGIQGGNAVANVLFGDFNPSGKLTASFPRNVGQEPLYYNQENTGRPAGRSKFTSKYIDIPNSPLYPFGYGLSYTTFEYNNLQLNTDSILPDGSITVTAEIENTGEYAGDEIVQLYIRDLVASLVQPVKELKGFTKIHLEPGEKKTVEFTLGPEQLGAYNRQMRFVVEPGDFRVWIGWNSAEGLEGNFKVTGK
ncbi:glycoside hydrolase family 3 N-terminal domain-containing protein, partial [candidate division KSB1 bacterium]